MESSAPTPAGIDFEAVNAFMGRLMRKWLGESVAESAQASILEAGSERLRGLILASSENSGVEERVIVTKLAMELGSEVGTRVFSWYESWSGATAKGSQAMNGALPGDAYIVYEKPEGGMASSILFEMLLDGKPGLVLTRKARPEILGFDVADVKIVMVRKQLARLFWPSSPTRDMSDRRDRTVDVPTEMPLLRIVRAQMESRPGSVVLVECAEYLRVLNGFQKFYTLLTDVIDIATDAGGTMLVSVNPLSFSDGDLATLETIAEILVERQPQAAHRSVQQSNVPAWSVNPA